MSTGSISPGLSDGPSCRILTVSASLSRAVDLVDRLRSLNPRTAGEASTSAIPPAFTSDAATSIPETQPEQPTLGASTRIPWTLANKYYSAAVHFSAHTITGLSPHVVREAPAVVFVWPKGEAYKHHITRLAGDMRGAEPEVALAVRVALSRSPESATEDEDEDGEEEDANVDEFLSGHGFEFVDASETGTPAEGEDEDGPFAQGIPGLPRVLDALSTIMWPSMVASSLKLGSKNRSKRDWEWARGSRDDEDGAAASPLGGLLRGGSRDQEMRDLTRWLEDEDGGEDPWRTAADSAVVESPTDSTPAFGSWEESVVGKEDEGKDGGFGFDDDFTVFVSAPPVSTEEDDSFDRDDDDEEPKGPGAHNLYRYSALGSALDLREGAGDGEKDEDAVKGEENTAKVGGKEDVEDEDQDEEDEDLPTDAEIEAMSARIFGHPPMPTLGLDAALNAVPLDAGAGAGGDSEYDMAPFDLSRVMSALERMKAEIAGMPDESERRKAAARVALGLVYGLEADAGVDEL
ncbi:hypothetical protein B0H11DRAFT_410676 [Mycena galericulata]|nr:hypothetical protein B0H11DRAFT_410676 [Mycena galericulata]